MSSGYDEETIGIIKSVFPDIDLNGNYIRIFENINIIESFFGLFIKNKKEERGKKKCFQFEIEDDHIYIHWLSKCGIIKGPTFLVNISILAEKLNQKGKQIKYIKLIDESHISICNKDICLRTIKILTTGKSWYNKYGYYSIDYENEKKHNQEMIEKNYTDFFVVLKENNDKTFIEKHTEMITESNKKIKQLLNIITDIEKELTQKENEKERYTGKMFSLYNLIRIHSTMLTNSDLTEHKQILSDEQQNKQSILDNFENNKQINSLLLEEFKETNIRTLFKDVLKIDLGKITVKELFSNIWKYISDTSKNCENEKFIVQFEWLVRFVNIIKKNNILLYKPTLKKIIKLTDDYSAKKYLKYKNKYLKYKNKYLNLKNQLG